MTNLLNELKTMETESTGVKNDVINWLLEDVEDYSPQDKLQDLLQNGCESGQVSHLIYYKDTVAYYEEHEEEIKDLVTEVYGIDFIKGSDFINQLSEIFPVDDFETRMNDDDDIIDRAFYNVSDNNDITEDELIKDYNCYEEEIFNERYELATELNMQDKNYLAWAVFEYNASVLFDELYEMDLIK